MTELELKTELEDNKLPKGWQRVRFKNIVENKKFAIVDGPFGTQLHADEYLNEGVPVVRITNLSFNGKFLDENFVFINKKKANILKRSEVIPGDIIIAKTGATIGKSGIFPTNLHKGIIASSCLKFTTKRRKISEKYILYFITWHKGQKQILNGASGSTRTTINIIPFSNIEIYLPFYLSEQCKIAEILETFDETIERTDAIIKKYKRIKQGLMQNLLTKGITVFEFEKDKLIAAVKRVFGSGDHSFGREENLVSHLSRHLNEFFPRWNVDSEVEKNNDRQRPDIIIHKRRTDENLFAIEVKKNENLNAIKKDIEKLEDVMLGDYHYKDVVFIGFDIDNFEDIFKLSEKVNFILVSKNGEIKVKSRVRRFKESPLGRIPKEWEVVELRENISVLLSNVDKKIFNFEQKILLCNYLDVYKNEYINNSISFMRGSANRREIKKFGVSKGNVIITKDSEEFNDIAKSVYVRDEINNLICGYHLALLKPSKRIDGLYLSKILKLYKVNSFFQRRANGITRFGISKETIEKALIPLPTLPEQKRIVSVLSQIDKTIEKEQKYKQKLEQIKQGLMENLLTGKVRVNHLINEGVESV